MLRFRGWHFTDNFVITRRPWKFDVHTWTDLVWARKLTTKHRVYLVIPAGTTHVPVLHFADGHRVVLPSSFSIGHAAGEDGVDRVLQLARERAPWAEFGFDDALVFAWRKDRAALCARLAQRREEILRAG